MNSDVADIFLAPYDESKDVNYDSDGKSVESAGPSTVKAIALFYLLQMIKIMNHEKFLRALMIALIHPIAKESRIALLQLKVAGEANAEADMMKPNDNRTALCSVLTGADGRLTALSSFVIYSLLHYWTDALQNDYVSDNPSTSNKDQIAVDFWRAIQLLPSGATQSQVDTSVSAATDETNVLSFEQITHLNNFTQQCQYDIAAIDKTSFLSVVINTTMMNANNLPPIASQVHH